jgi:hypothetical protein
VNGAWNQIANFGSGTTSFAVTGLAANTTYYFTAAASNSAGTTWASNYVSATTNSAAATLTIDHPTAATAYSTVSGSLFGANGPLYTDVRQGTVGDCWLLSSLAEVAVRLPNDIRNMFNYTGTTVENGVTVSLYSVRFFDSSNVARYVTVDTELPSSGSYYDQVTSGVLWVALAEKAYAEANGKGYVTTQHTSSDSYSALDGGMPSWALHAITGLSASDFAINPTNLAAAWNAGKLIVLGSSANANDNLIVGDSTHGVHAYAVVGYSGSQYELLNPWNTTSTVNGFTTYYGHQVYGGAFWISTTVISQDFNMQSIAGAAAASEAGGGSQQNAGGVTTALYASIDRAMAALAFATPMNQMAGSLMASDAVHGETLPATLPESFDQFLTRLTDTESGHSDSAVDDAFANLTDVLSQRYSLN